MSSFTMLFISSMLIYDERVHHNTLFIRYFNGFINLIELN